ncbi:pyridoxamine 5'-phosphate oxidase family protein [Streptomyces coeruleorubidus]|uniref:pyridoxamine 5'-phosphate oxidase family protein n=1 Tax=Streptomyces coeruleorubidus TaxID=116188 RepID=UPI0037023E1C
MAVFTAQEVVFLQEHRLGRLATAGRSGKPHVVPISYHLDPEHEVIKIGGRVLEGSGQDRMYIRHLKVNPQAALVVDDVPDEQSWQPRGILIKGQAILHTEGGEKLGPGFGPQWVEIVPTWTTSWGVDVAEREPGTS